MSNQDLIYRLRKRAEIRRQISTRKSVQEGKPDRIADLLEEAAKEIESLNIWVRSYDQVVNRTDGKCPRCGEYGKHGCGPQPLPIIENECAFCGCILSDDEAGYGACGKCR
jgi:ribosomal protein S27AE